MSRYDYLTDIEDYIKDAQKGRRHIYFSTTAFAEIRPQFLKRKGYGSMHEFMADFKNAFSPVESAPDLMIAAGELRDAVPTNPSDPKAKPRVVGLGDAIHLMTCLYLRDILAVPEVVFHTFDDGKGTSWEGKCVPLLSFERWFPAPAASSRAADVCGLRRCLPAHPQTRLKLGMAG